MIVSSAFDGGNIRVVKADAPGDIRLEINKDNQSDFYQWFYFRVAGVRGEALGITIGDLKKSAYPDGWPNYRAVASYDRETWFRVDTEYEEGTLKIGHEPEVDAVYFAYFAPYSMERHADLVARTALSPGVAYECLGHTLDGQPIDLLKIGERGKAKKICWIIARQHPGETMAEWWMEGCLTALTDPFDPIANALKDKAVFYIVPNMNPDGSRRGHLRTNACGANLNREWDRPTLEKSPEVFRVRNRMDETGVDFCLDVHGDEAIPHNFIAGFEGTPSATKPRLQLLDKYKSTLAELTPDFQTKRGYPPAKPGKANMSMCTNQTAERYGALSMTLEMPFKDTADRPDPRYGWSPPRCRHLARHCLQALYLVVDEL